jgi:hypothetical protein
LKLSPLKMMILNYTEEICFFFFVFKMLRMNPP